MKKLFQDVLANLLANIAYIAITGAITALVSIASSVTVIIIQTKGDLVPGYCWLLLALSLLIGVVCLSFAIIFFVKRSCRPNFPIIKADVKYEKAIIELFFKDRENIFTSVEMRLEVLCDELKKMTKKFTWSGSGYKSTVLQKAKGNYTLKDTTRKHSPLEFEVIFDSTKVRGDKIWYKTNTVLEDLEHIMQPHLSQLIKNPTDYLELRVTAPVGLLNNVVFVEYADTTAEIPITKPLRLSEKNVGNLETYEYRINHPNILHNYRIEWEFRT
ncbi:MAG: hypothetical protein LBS02_07705 [Hungatella sp.]|jgi:hypothetical protein|nr:hypothetical protein [Hungatella sp.]